MKITKTWLENEIKKGTMDSFSMKLRYLGTENGHEIYSDDYVPTYTVANNHIHVTKDEDTKKLPEDVRVRLLTKFIKQQQQTTSDISTDYNILMRYLETKIKDDKNNFQTNKEKKVTSMTYVIKEFEKLLKIQTDDLHTEQEKRFTLGLKQQELSNNIKKTQGKIDADKKELSHINGLQYTESEDIQPVKDIVRAYEQLVGHSVPPIHTGLSLQELKNNTEVTSLLIKIMKSKKNYGVKVVVSDEYKSEIYLNTSITIDGNKDWLKIPKYQLLIRFLLLRNEDESTIKEVLETLPSVYQDEINAYKWALCQKKSQVPIDWFIRSMMQQVDVNQGDTTAPPDGECIPVHLEK